MFSICSQSWILTILCAFHFLFSGNSDFSLESEQLLWVGVLLLLLLLLLFISFHYFFMLSTLKMSLHLIIELTFFKVSFIFFFVKDSIT